MGKNFILVVCALVSPVSAGSGLWHRKGCDGELSDGPTEAAVEITIGNLPASTSSKPVYLSWWAAKQSQNEYNPLTSPSSAQVYSSARRRFSAYGKYGEADYNGGKVRVNEEGKATVRVRAPATYQGCSGYSKARMPHVHFTICGAYGHPKKIIFASNGPYVKGGCWNYGKGGTQSYKVLTSKLLDMPTMEPQKKEIVAAEVEQAEVEQETEKEMQEKDMDAIEFSPVYDCLAGAELFDQFSSNCSAQCPSHADMAHAQCVRKPVSGGMQAVLEASWRLHIDCNEKCWSDMVPVSHHMVRLALADHLDITFQEVTTVQMRKDEGSPTTHAHLSVKIHSNRLDSEQDSSLLASFLTNASMASDLLGLTVHDVEGADGNDGGDASSVATDANVPGENADQYSEYYAPLENDAEQKAKARGKSTIAGVEVPEGVPMDVIIGAAAAILIFFVVVGGWLRRRRRQQLAEYTNNASVIQAEKVDETDEKVEKPKVDRMEIDDDKADKAKADEIEIEVDETSV